MGYGQLNEEFEYFNVLDEVKRFERFASGEGEPAFFMDLMMIDEIFDYYQETDKPDFALRLMDYAISNHPYISDFYYKKATVEGMLGKYVEAYESIEQAIRQKPHECQYLILKSKILTYLDLIPQAIEILYDALEITREPAEVYKAIGSLHYSIGKSLHSVRFYAQALALDPSREDLIYDIVDAYDTNEDLEGAIRFCNNFIDDNPYSYHAWYNLGLLYLKQGLFEKALDSFEYSIIIDPTQVGGYQAKARCYIEMDKLDQAISVLLESLYQDKKNGISLIALGECYQELELYDRARYYYTQCAQYYPELPDAYLGIASTFECEEKYVSAIHYYKEALKHNEAYYDAWVGLAECEFLLGNKNSAYDALTQALAYHTDDISLWIDWAERLDEDGNLQGALIMLEEGIMLLPHEVELYYRYAAYLFKAGRTREAYNYLENALLLNFDRHTLLYEFCPQVAQLRPIQEIIEQYRPR